MYQAKRLFILVLIFGFSLTANSQTNDIFDKGKLKSYLNIIHLKKRFSGEILVAKDKNVLFQETVGLASYENNLKLNKGAKYRIASITKTFTGTLVAVAQEEGKLNVQDKAIDYVNGLSQKFKDITIEQLLSHTSGLPHNEGINDYWQTKSKLQMTTKQVISEINKVDLLFEPGTKWHYSSLGYYLLATILENVYKKNFENILKDEILDKLQMTETGIADNLEIIPHMTPGYHLVTDDSLVVAPYRNYSMLKGAGDIYSNATDLLKWNNSFFSNTLLSEKTKEAMFEQQDKTVKLNSEGYGYGWYINFEKPVKYYHGGGTWGYSTYNSMYPDKRISIIILSNVSTLPISTIASDVEKIVFDQNFRLPTIEKEITNENINLDKYNGLYVSESSNIKLLIFKAGNSLYAKLGQNPTFEIYLKGENSFFGKKVELEIIFNVKEGMVTGLTAKRMGRSFQFNKSHE